MTRNCRVVVVCALGFALYRTTLGAQDLARYREFELGSEVAAVSAVTGVAVPEVKIVHHRPALIQQLTWRPRYDALRRTALGTESVDTMVFSFYDDQLFRVTVDYDRERTQGLTEADMIEAISATYGSRVNPTISRSLQTPSRYENDLGSPLARWESVDHSVVLYRPSWYTAGFRLVVTAEPMAALARTAAARALVLDAREAPQREAARKKKEADDQRATEEKARSTNKTTFRP